MSESSGDFELVRGSGNVFRDFGHPAADVEQTKAILAAKIIGILEDEGLSTRKAQEKTGINHADFARIRSAKLDRFTIDRLMTIVDRLGRQVHVRISVQPRALETEEVSAHR
ncbi:MAG TPA: helix-turn-helix transcriptional regulator [Bryobacterales bacterium]|nr:helix-turn-helix transcriptional regulator [Bryobacterales bacterium]